MKFQITKIVLIEGATKEEALAKFDQGQVKFCNIHLVTERVGRELKLILAKFGLTPASGCKCAEHIREMDRNGIDWCRKNIDIIVGWLEEEAVRAKLPFTTLGARILVRRAISNAKKKQK